MVTDEVNVLLFLKAAYKEKAGGEWVPVEKRGKDEKKKENKENQQQQKPKENG